MNDQQLMRYARHILLDNFGVEKQKIINNSHIVIIGLGGLGSSSSMYLASSGIGTITLVDNDYVEISNLQRQIAHTNNSIGMSKVDSAKERLLSLNPKINIRTLCKRIDRETLVNLLERADLVVDCSDNFDTRYLINEVCYKLDKIIISGAAIRFTGQVSVYDFRNKNNPCYNCIFPYDLTDLSERENCATTGVFAPLVGVIGSIQAAEAIKVLTGIGKPLTGRLLNIDMLSSEFRISNFYKDNKCLVCNK